MQPLKVRTQAGITSGTLSLKLHINNAVHVLDVLPVGRRDPNFTHLGFDICLTPQAQNRTDYNYTRLLNVWDGGPAKHFNQKSNISDVISSELCGVKAPDD